MFGGLCAGWLAILGCSENVHPGTSRETVCSAITDDAFSWWLAVLWPVVAYAATCLVARLRSHVLAIGLALAALAAGFWTTLLVILAS